MRTKEIFWLISKKELNLNNIMMMSKTMRRLSQIKNKCQILILTKVISVRLKMLIKITILNFIIKNHINSMNKLIKETLLWMLCSTSLPNKIKKTHSRNKVSILMTIYCQILQFRNKRNKSKRIKICFLCQQF